MRLPHGPSKVHIRSHHAPRRRRRAVIVWSRCVGTLSLVATRHCATPEMWVES